MPCLDANALSDDADGMAFLAAVLEVPAPVAGTGFDISAPRGWTIVASAPPCEVAGMREVAEAA